MKTTGTNQRCGLALLFATQVIAWTGTASAQERSWKAVPVAPPAEAIVIAQTPPHAAPPPQTQRSYYGVGLGKPLVSSVATTAAATPVAPATAPAMLAAPAPAPATPVAECLPASEAKPMPVTLGKPVAHAVMDSEVRRSDPAVIRASRADDPPFPPPPPFLQVAGIDPLRDSGPAPVPTPFPPVPLTTPETPTLNVSRSNPPDSVGPVAGDPGLLPGVVADQPVAPTKWYQRLGEMFTWGDPRGGQKATWCSDGSFPGLISPVTMPFYFEDPRALTEIRPIFIFQSIPSSTPNVGGGNAWFLGTQARLAFDDRFSLVLSQLGIVGTDGSNPLGPINDTTGFAEVKIGPKYTFLKYADLGSVAAVGLDFALPVGSSKVYQDTGNLGLTPYLSYGQAFGRLPGGYGSLNFLGTTGYAASLNNERSEFFFLNLHLDCNIANMNSWFPFVEVNWIQYTKSGNRGNFGFEGADLINFGSTTRQGSTYFTVGPGLRYRFNDNIFLGAAVEIPLTREKGLADYRLTVDAIFRY